MDSRQQNILSSQFIDFEQYNERGSSRNIQEGFDLTTFHKILQINSEGASNNFQKMTSVRGNGVFISPTQNNRKWSFLNVQHTTYHHFVTPIQINEADSGGNIQINYGNVFSVAREPPQQSIDNKYSFNLQYNVAEDCSKSDEIFISKGNIRINKCSTSKYFYHDAGYAIYQIFERDCSNRDFLKIKDGKVLVTLCTGALMEKPPKMKTNINIKIS